MQESPSKTDHTDLPFKSLEHKILNKQTEEINFRKGQIDIQTIEDGQDILSNQKTKQTTVNEFQNTHYNNNSHLNDIMGGQQNILQHFDNIHNFNSNNNKNIKQNNILQEDDYVDQLFGNEPLCLLFNNEFELHNRFFQQSSNLMQQNNLFSKQNLLQVPSNPFAKENSNDIQKSEINSENGDGENGTRNVSRGLRKLSLKVKQIVQEKKQTTYKEVAETLVQQMKAQAIQDNISQESLQKDEQNIKRRVYDALNVLIAAQVINKKGKIVSSIENTKLSGKCLNTQNWKQMKEQQQKLDEKKQLIQGKKQIVLQLLKQNIALKNLQQRNKQKEQRQIEQYQMQQQQSQESINKFFKSQDGQRILSFQNNNNNINNNIQNNTIQHNLINSFNNENNNNNIQNGFLNSQQFAQFTQSPFQSQLSQNHNINNNQTYKNIKLNKKTQLENYDVQSDQQFHFPMIMSIFNKQQNEDDNYILKMSKDQKQFKMYSKQPLNVYGDLDILTKCGFDKVPQDFLYKNFKDPRLVKFYLSQNIYTQSQYQQQQEQEQELKQEQQQQEEQQEQQQQLQYNQDQDQDQFQENQQFSLDFQQQNYDQFQMSQSQQQQLPNSFSQYKIE